MAKNMDKGANIGSIYMTFQKGKPRDTTVSQNHRGCQKTIANHPHYHHHQPATHPPPPLSPTTHLPLPLLPQLLVQDGLEVLILILVSQLTKELLKLLSIHHPLLDGNVSVHLFINVNITHTGGYQLLPHLNINSLCAAKVIIL